MTDVSASPDRPKQLSLGDSLQNIIIVCMSIRLELKYKGKQCRTASSDGTSVDEESQNSVIHLEGYTRGRGALLTIE